jgi:hypothetical protein
MPVIIADNVQRNIDSAKALASGFGLDPTTTVRVDAAPFTRCTPPSKSDETTLVEQRLKTVPKPANYTAMIATIDAVLGGTSKVTAHTPFSDKQAQCTRGRAGCALLITGLAMTPLPFLFSRVCAHDAKSCC